MDGYWWGVLTPFAIILGILLLWLAGSLFGAIVSWAWKKAHYGLVNYRDGERRGLDVGVTPRDSPVREVVAGTPSIMGG